MTRHAEDVKRLIDAAERGEDFVFDVDGYVYFAPSSNGRHLSAWMLRALADELDRRNAPWQAIIDADPVFRQGITINSAKKEPRHDSPSSLRRRKSGADR